jgi:uncharacterized protein (DUF3084 family)
MAWDQVMDVLSYGKALLDLFGLTPFITAIAVTIVAVSAFRRFFGSNE